MEFNKYQKESRKTAIYPKIGKSYVYPTLGLANEAGEFAGKIKKIFRDDGGKVTKEKKQDLIHELGDILWYLSQIATEFNFKLSDVAEENLKKLSSRKERGVLHGSGDNR
jgi:NTP pyrophosphatase (non-canonical NTP hydrolase)